MTKRRRAALHEAVAARLARCLRGAGARPRRARRPPPRVRGDVADRDRRDGRRGARPRAAGPRRLGAAGLRAYGASDAAAARRCPPCRPALRRRGARAKRAQLALANSLLWMGEDAEAEGVLADVRRSAERRADARVLARPSVAERQIPLGERPSRRPTRCSRSWTGRSRCSRRRATTGASRRRTTCGSMCSTGERRRRRWCRCSTARSTTLDARDLPTSSRGLGRGSASSCRSATNRSRGARGGDPIRDTTPNPPARGSAIGATGLLRARKRRRAGASARSAPSSSSWAAPRGRRSPSPGPRSRSSPATSQPPRRSARRLRAAGSSGESTRPRTSPGGSPSSSCAWDATARRSPSGRGGGRPARVLGGRLVR